MAPITRSQGRDRYLGRLANTLIRKRSQVQVFPGQLLSEEPHKDEVGGSSTSRPTAQAPTSDNTGLHWSNATQPQPSPSFTSAPTSPVCALRPSCLQVMLYSGSDFCLFWEYIKYLL